MTDDKMRPNVNDRPEQPEQVDQQTAEPSECGGSAGSTRGAGTEATATNRLFSDTCAYRKIHPRLATIAKLTLVNDELSTAPNEALT